MGHLNLAPQQQLVRGIKEHGSAIYTQSIKATIHWVPGQSAIPGNEVAELQANQGQED